MNRTTTNSIRTMALLALLLTIGCSKSSSDSQSAGADSGQPATGRKATSDTDKTCAAILQAPNSKEAREWVKQNPKSVFSVAGEDGNVMLGPTVAKLYQAGAERIVIEQTQSGYLSSMVVVLPTEPAARQRLFALDAQLSPLREQTPARDSGQKYLHYDFK